MTKDAEHPLTGLICIAAKAGIGLLPGGGLLTAGYEGLQLLSKGWRLYCMLDLLGACENALVEKESVCIVFS